MDLATVTATVSSSLFIAGTAAGAARWYVKHHSDESIKEALEELRPNHGSSINDAIKLQILPIVKALKDDITEVKADIKELRGTQIEVVKDIARLEGRVTAHVEDNVL